MPVSASTASPPPRPPSCNYNAAMHIPFSRYARRAALLPALLLLPAACGEEVEALYAALRAFFRFASVATTPPLHSALNNPGQFCAITVSATAYLFTGPDGTSASYTPTAIDRYTTPECVCGFVVGIPAVPDMSTGSAVVAYDLVCPNCYDDRSLNLKLSFSGQRALACRSSRGCGRVYDLDNGGRVSSGGDGRSLFRYRASYSADQGVLLIQNN